MRKFTDNLSRVRVAAPCPADWDRMVGDNRKRFCGECRMNVYNLSNMSRGDAEAFVTNAEGRLCVRFYRRRDGSILTADCPTGLRVLKRRASLLARAALSSVLSFLAGVGISNSLLKSDTVDHPSFKYVTPSEPSIMGYAVSSPLEAEQGQSVAVAGAMVLGETATMRRSSSKTKKSFAR